MYIFGDYNINRLICHSVNGISAFLKLQLARRVSDQEVLSRAEMSRVTCLIRERQLCFYGHVGRFTMDDPTHRILNAKDPVE